MGRTRSFYPPAHCDKCEKTPPVGHTLWHSGVIWLCPACLADATPGSDLTTKTATKFVSHEAGQVMSKRERSAGDIESADYHERQSHRQADAVESLRSYANQQMSGVVIASGEATKSAGYLRDTLADPDLVAVESSEMRGRLLQSNDIVSLGLDVSNTIGATNTMEKMLAHEIALAHKIANEQASMASRERDPAMEMKRLQVSARMMQTVQQGMQTLHKLRTGGTQNVIVQHVHVANGGQAVVGAVQRGASGQKERI